MNLLSIQSHVAFGHVGNSAAIFALQRIGVEVWPVHTVQFSNHPGYGDVGGEVFDPRLIRGVIDGIDRRGVFGECDGVLSGYVGSSATGVAILDAVSRVKYANPAARYCCDPVMGDVGGGLYVPRDVANFIKAQAVPAADIVTPNHFELDMLAGCESRTLAQAFAAIDTVHDSGPRIVVVTSVHLGDTPAGSLDLLASDGQHRVRVRTPRLAVAVNGAGDMFAALYFAHYLRSGSAAEALALTASAVFGVLEKTVEAGSRELLLVAAQDDIAAPRRVFEYETLGVPPGRELL